MGIFDDVMVNAKTAANAVGRKAEQIVDYSKLKYAESGINNEISEKLSSLGSFVYESMVAGEMDKADLEKRTAELSELYRQLEMTREMIAASKNKKCCKSCGSLSDKDSLFCGKCGARLAEEEKNGQPAQPDPEESEKPQEQPAPAQEQVPQPELQVLETPENKE